MKNLRILEDNSPYFITFTFDGIDDIIDIGKDLIQNHKKVGSVTGIKLDEQFNVVTEQNPQNLDDYKNAFINIRKWPEEFKDKIIETLPWQIPEWDIKSWEFTILHSGPGYFHCVHKDRADTGINFFIQVPDDLCITHYYSEEEIDEKSDHAFAKQFYDSVGNDDPAKYERLGGPIRRAFGVDPKNLTPIKTFIGKQSNGMLINTALWHTWNNTSDKDRAVMSIRPLVPSLSRKTFEEMRLQLFGF